MLLDKVNLSISEYLKIWREEIAKSANAAFLGGLQLTAVGWKVASHEAFNKALLELQPHATVLHIIWLNERWFADIGLREELKGNMRVIKLMQRRPGSADVLGLDHVDFLSPSLDECKKILSTEQSLAWQEERNNNCRWISITFADKEAKLRSDLALDAAIEDIEDFKKSITRVHPLPQIL